MAILQRHIPFYKEIFALPDFFAEPVLVFGFQEVRIHPTRLAPFAGLPLPLKLKKIRRELRRLWKARTGGLHPDQDIPEAFRVADIIELLGKLGVGDLRVLDLFDPRAGLRYDMNRPVPEAEHERYGTLIDIGCIEHVFDTRQCLENCLRMVRPGGTYALTTCVNGYHGHGLHVFNPEGLVKGLEQNGFEVLYCRYSTKDGLPVEDPARATDALIWLVGRKRESLTTFRIPQQGLWQTSYAGVRPDPASAQ